VAGVLGEDQQNRVGVVRDGFEAFDRGDLLWLQEHFSPDIMVRVPGSNRFSGVYSGVGQAIALVAEAVAVLGGYSLRVLDVVGDQSVVAATYMLTLRRLDGESMQTLVTQLFSFSDDDRIQETWIEVEDEAAIDRFIGERAQVGGLE